MCPCLFGAEVSLICVSDHIKPGVQKRKLQEKAKPAQTHDHSAVPRLQPDRKG